MSPVNDIQRIKLEVTVGSQAVTGLLESRKDETPLVNVVLHPHPLYGGNMDNSVVKELVHLFHTLDEATFRFNFRGADFRGDFTGIKGAVEDFSSAIKKIESIDSYQLRGILGYSFGGSVALLAGGLFKPDFVVALSPSMRLIRDFSDWDSILQNISCPILLVHGNRDSTVPVTSSQYIARVTREELTSTVILENEDHFYSNSLSHTCEIIKDLVTSLNPE
ncbi:MAG: hypothetical protein BAJATHORv1_10097 [Candidatus Thorarchaeota archaeon]|nr:MAG: hypothetical protein BAJATHORv1_10097 [Candidatus Thorarchaeota archaeon]